MTYEEIVAGVKAAYADADASHITDHVAFQFNVTGKAKALSMWRSKTAR